MILKSNKKKKNNVMAATATLLMLVTILSLAGPVSTTTIIGINQSADATFDNTRTSKMRTGLPAAPAVVSGDNIYVAWWTNNTENGNEEVMFRASNDAGQTFADKINLSNTTDADSWRAEIAGEGDNVVVTWWETNQTSDTPAARISNDAGQTFGPLLMLGTNGTISTSTNDAITVPEEEDDIGNNAGTTGATTTTDDGDATISVSIVPGSSELTDNAYQPNPIEVSVGDTVTWTNDDATQHTVTSGESGAPDDEFDSRIMAPGATFEHSFTEAGEYPYFCTPHPNMVGTVIVS